MKILLTGATSGLGKATAFALVKQNHHLILGNRNQQKATKLKQQLLEMNPNANIDLYQVDLASFESVNHFIMQIKQNYPSIDVLINNAGVLMRTPSLTKDGFETTMQVNHLSTFLITKQLISLLPKKGKVVMVSSVGSYLGKLSPKASVFNTFKNTFRTYFNSKQANLIATQYLQENHPTLIIKAADPGIAYSNIWSWKNKRFIWLDTLYKKCFSSSEKAARIIVALATSNTFDNDKHLIYKYKKPRRLPKPLKNKAFCQTIIDYTNELINPFESNKI